MTGDQLINRLQQLMGFSDPERIDLDESRNDIRLSRDFTTTGLDDGSDPTIFQADSMDASFPFRALRGQSGRQQVQTTKRPSFAFVAHYFSSSS